MDPVRFGIIGCGVVARQHLQAASDWPTIRMVAVADIRKEAAEKTAAEFGVERAYGSAAELLQDREIQAVVLALPTSIRTPVALQALAAGKHVLLEKPAAMNVRDLEQITAARGRLTVACCSSRSRFLTSAGVAAREIASGKLGALRVLRCRDVRAAGQPPASPPPAWRLLRRVNGGGVLVNWGVYDLDYLLGLCGWKLEPRAVFAATWPLPPQFAAHVPQGSDSETYYTAMIRCTGGEMICLERGEYMTCRTDQTWQILGTRGSLSLNMIPNQGNAVIHDDTTTAEGVVTRTVWQGDDTWDQFCLGPIRDFADALSQGRPPMTPLEQGLVIQKITDAVYASAESGKMVEIR